MFSNAVKTEQKDFLFERALRLTLLLDEEEAYVEKVKSQE